MTADELPLVVDHVTIAGRDLERLADALAAAGLEPEYGGPHSNGVTHMSSLGFDDGSYVELISTVESDRESPWWDRHIAGDAGSCGWAIRTDDIRAAVERIAAAGVPVSGPEYYHRERPDGTLVEWDLAFPGEGEPGTTLPFLIQDRTPREFRVQPTPSVAESELTGVATVVLGVEDLDGAIERFRGVFGLSAPEIETDGDFEARVARFPGTPVALAAPLSGSWLADRLAQFGPAPCAYLLGTTDWPATVERTGVGDESSWFGRRVGWLDLDGVGGRFGVVERRQ